VRTGFDPGTVDGVQFLACVAPGFDPSAEGRHMDFMIAAQAERQSAAKFHF
jgi:hypothetical protein